MSKVQFDSRLAKVYQTLLERFGEPMKPQTKAVGIADEGPGDKALWDDEPKKDRPWSDPSVVKEGDFPPLGEGDDVSCHQCGSMKTEMEGDSPCTCGG